MIKSQTLQCKSTVLVDGFPPQYLKLQENCWHIFKLCPTLISNSLNTKILMISRTPIWVIFQNSVTFIEHILHIVHPHIQPQLSEHFNYPIIKRDCLIRLLYYFHVLLE